jgi:hypothetical protein
LRPKASENPGAECLTNVEVELGEIHVGGETGVEATLQGDEVDGGHREGRLSSPLIGSYPLRPANSLHVQRKRHELSPTNCASTARRCARRPVGWMRQRAGSRQDI